MEQSHLSEQELAAYINGKLNDSIKEQHIKACLHCQKQVFTYRLIDQFLESKQVITSVVDDTFVWNNEVLAQIEQMEYSEEKRRYFWLITTCIVGWVGLIAWLGYMGIFNNLWQILSGTTGRVILTTGIIISVFISCFDWLEKRLKLDPLRILMQEKR
ncbi:hypothetical protein [Emticicia sp. BO119]|uniref:hypothetical protein n=1 Tax=Emticicia sp. BO119 TaxID=2757768 RepID=UPI0015F03E15|nr:hypothetical protein [Emticicia sp. BO119]MBA4853040.1 hypothetical protein [Emticicia sp. BO119]